MCRRSCLLLALVMAGCGRQGEEPAIGEGFVAPATLNVRKDLGPRQPSVASVRHGERVEILATRRRFAKVRTSSGAVGWTESGLLFTPQQMAELRALGERAAAVQPKPKPRKDELAAPEEIPDERAAEADGPLAEAAPVEDTAPVAEAAPAPAVVEAPPPPPPKLKPKAEGPVQLPEQATPPVAVAGNTPPEYPEEARKAGIQAVVIAKIVVRADGSVASVDILRGAEIFHAAVKAALMTWHYEPARLPDGTAISVFRIVQLPFKLENM